MLAKIIVTGATPRRSARRKLQAALDATRDRRARDQSRLSPATVAPSDIFARGEMLTRDAADVRLPGRHRSRCSRPARRPRCRIGRGALGYWAVGVPPSGPMDPLSFRLANRLVGNDEDAAGSRCTLAGPTLQVQHATPSSASPAPSSRATLDGEPVPYWQAVAVKAGQMLKLGGVTGPGARAYLAVRGGIDVPDYLGSRSTFTLGKFGGHGGRALRAGDVLHIGERPRRRGEDGGARRRIAAAADRMSGRSACSTVRTARRISSRPTTSTTFFATDWEVHYNSNPHRRPPDRPQARLGARGRRRGGAASVATSTTTPMPSARSTSPATCRSSSGPTGRSLGGFVCPVDHRASRAVEDGPASPRRQSPLRSPHAG